MASSRLAENIAHFARVLRRAGLPIGPGKVLAAIDAVRWVDLERRDDVRTALAATLLDRADQRVLFDQAFVLFWRDPKLLERAMHLLLPRVSGRLGDRADHADHPTPGNRVKEALQPTRAEPADAAEQRIELDAALTFSAREVLQHKDFETMTLEEVAQAQRVLKTLRLALPAVPTRRYSPTATGAILDLRATLRKSLRAGGEWVSLRRRQQRSRPSKLVALCDISGSMARYSRMLLHFLHALSTEQQHVHVFTFGTRLTNITRALRYRDVDRALAEVGHVVPDWSGGTQIGACIKEFNLRWSRRLLAQGATVLIVSDGLDSSEGPDLGVEMQRLRASCRRILWLNPLLRFDGFEPRAAGIRAMLPHVDRFLPAHNMASLLDLGHALGALSHARARSLH